MSCFSTNNEVLSYQDAGQSSDNFPILTAGACHLILHLQVWSDSRAVEEYRDLLSGKVQKDAEDCASVIIGRGRIGQALKDLGRGDDLFVERGGIIPAEHEGLKSFPIYVSSVHVSCRLPMFFVLIKWTKSVRYVSRTMKLKMLSNHARKRNWTILFSCRWLIDFLSMTCSQSSSLFFLISR